MAPRGIVAAAVSSLFAQALDAAGIEGGAELRALVFLVIAVSVLAQGLSGGVLARWLGVRRPSNTGVAFLGANTLALAVAEVYRGAGVDVLLLDSNPDACQVAEQRDFRVVFGNALEPRLLARAEIDNRAECIGLTPNDEVNLLFSRRVREISKSTQVATALSCRRAHATPQMVEKLGASVLWDGPQYLGLWAGRVEREHAVVERWRCKTPRPPEGPPETETAEERERTRILLPLAVVCGERVRSYSSELTVRPGDELHVLVQEDKRELAHAWLEQQGWRLSTPAEVGEAQG